jgi:hypothetical protein
MHSLSCSNRPGADRFGDVSGSGTDGYSPMAPSTDPRNRSAWPLCRAYSPEHMQHDPPQARRISVFPGLHCKTVEPTVGKRFGSCEPLLNCVTPASYCSLHVRSWLVRQQKAGDVVRAVPSRPPTHAATDVQRGRLSSRPIASRRGEGMSRAKHSTSTAWRGP